MVFGCAAPELVRRSRLLAENVAAGQPEDTIARVAVLVPVLAEPQGKRALAVHLLPMFDGRGHSEKKQ